MNATKTRAPQARHVVIVDDGACLWIGKRSQVYGWLSQHELSRICNSVAMSAEQYQELCDGTTCYADTSGSYAVPGHDTHALIQRLSEAGAPTLTIA